MTPRIPPVMAAWAQSRTGRVVLSAVAVVAIAAIATTVGLTVGTNGPADEAAPEDAYATAPGCGSVPSGTVESAVPGAALDARERGPLAAADGATCVWTSVDSADDAPRVLHIDFTANFTDSSEDRSGAAIATEQVEQLRTSSGATGESVPNLGENALVREAASEGGTAEVAFALDNLVVRVLYGGDEDSEGEELSFDDAREGAVTVAEQLAEDL